MSFLNAWDGDTKRKKSVKMWKQLRNVLICHLLPKRGFLESMKNMGQQHIALCQIDALYYPTVN